MYVTRTLSHYINSPEALYLAPERPNSGYLVIQDEESKTYSCFGHSNDGRLPFPQNKTLTVEDGDTSDEVVFIPVLNQPLSSNRYYAIQPHGSHKGQAFTSSKEEDMVQCCFSTCVDDVLPRPLNPHDSYQQFEIVQWGNGRFYAKSLADDGYPPNFLGRKGWRVYTRTPNYVLHEAKGINHALRSLLLDSNSAPSIRTSNYVVVGKWYCPFVFIKEGRLSDQVKKSMFYEMTLEQKWECVFEKENRHNNDGDVVYVEVAFPSESVFVGESQREAVWDEKNIVAGVVWFTCLKGDNHEEERVGLSLEIVERMRWEEEIFGWVSDGVKRTKMIKREEKFVGIGGWSKFGCYVLVERFVLRKMDGSLVLSYEFGHTHQIKTIFD